MVHPFLKKNPGSAPVMPVFHCHVMSLYQIMHMGTSAQCVHKKAAITEPKKTSEIQFPSGTVHFSFQLPPLK